MQKVYLVGFTDTRLGIVIANEAIHNAESHKGENPPKCNTIVLRFLAESHKGI